MANEQQTRVMERLTRYVRFVLLGGVLFAASCTDLTEVPFTEVTQANFNPTEEDIPSLVAPVYTNLRSALACCYGFVTMQASAGDSFITPGRPNGWGGPYIPYHKHEWSPVHPYVTALWNNMYDGINAANRVLYQVQSGRVPISEELQGPLVAELRAVRAYYYYRLMDNYGSVPIVTDFTSEELPVQATRQEVYDFVVQELTEAIPQLSETADQSTYGRMNRWAAMTVLADVYLNAEVYTGTPAYMQVIEVTDEIINSAQYQLVPDYRSNFTRTNNTSTETILAVPYDEIYAGGNTMHMRALAPVQQQVYDMQAQPWGGSSPTPQFINTYNVDDTRLEDTYAGGPQYNDQDELIADFSLNVTDIELAEFDEGYRIIKYEIYEGMSVSSDVDFPIYRYADVLMMNAEALLRTGSAAQAAAIVTQVRQRAFAETDPSKATVTAAELQQGSTFNYGYWENGQVVNAPGGEDIQYGRMLDELGWEFAVEGHRRQDMIRFGVFTTKTWFNHRPSDPCKTIFPIPQSALEANSNLVQHSCYQ